MEDLTAAELDVEKMEWLRAERLHLLECSENSWMANAHGTREDRPYTADQLAWRQALRDFPSTVTPDQITSEKIEDRWFSPVTGDDLAENNLELDADSTEEPGVEPEFKPGHYGFACDDLWPEPPAGFERIHGPDDEFKKSGGVSKHIVNLVEIHEKTGVPTGKILNPDGVNFDANGPLKGQDGWWIKK